jgi:hypothetical protein
MENAFIASTHSLKCCPCTSSGNILPDCPGLQQHLQHGAVSSYWLLWSNNKLQVVQLAKRKLARLCAGTS